MKKWRLVLGLGVVILLLFPAMNAGAGQVAVSEAVSFCNGGQCPVAVPEVAESGSFQAIDDVVGSYEDFKLAVLRHFLAKDTSFTISFQCELTSVSAWLDQMDKDQDVPWLSHSWHSYSMYGGQVSTVSFNFNYWHTQAQEIELQAAARDQVRQLVSDDMDLPAREKAIHDWIVRQVTYDQSSQRYSDYDAFYSHSAVCQGYALLTSRMLAMAGIENRIVAGTANGGDHAWNMVNLCGSWFHLDTTFDDPIGMPADSIRWDYFNLTDGAIGADHDWNFADYPACMTAYTDGFCPGVQNVCSIFTPQNCLDELQCLNIGGTWNGACTVPGSDGGGGVDPGEAALAAPQQAMAAVTYGAGSFVYPEYTLIELAAGPILLQPRLQVAAGDAGKSAGLFVYISLPGSAVGFNFSAPAPVTLGSQVNFSKVFPKVLDFSQQHNFVFDVYYGYVLSDGTIRYNAYEVGVDALLW